VALVMILGVGSLATAQERGPEITVIQTAVAEPKQGATTLPLSVFFSLRDQNGDVVPRSALNLAGAQGTLTVKPVGGEPLPSVPITVNEPQTPINIALVLDRSGSMNVTVGDAGGEQRTLDAIVRAAAVDSIKVAPAQAEFAVFSFAEKPELRSGSGFLRRSDQEGLITDAINGYTTNKAGTGNTCITDAALEAINYLNANSGNQSVNRKALILFTDGIDKEANGRPTNGNDCSNLGFDAVIRSAQLSSGTVIPIYTIWPCTEPCNDQQRAGLENLARETRGTAAIGSLQEVGTMFQQVMDVLNSQWVVQADVPVQQGTNTATLEVTSGDGALLTGVTPPFESTITTLQESEISVAQVARVDSGENYKVTVRITNPESVGAVLASVYDQADGGVIVVDEKRFDQLQSQLDFEVQGDRMTSGETYYLRISAVGADGQPIRDAKGEAFLITYPFTYDPKFSYTIGEVTPAWDANQLVVAVDARGAGQRVLTFKGRIIKRDQGNPEDLSPTVLRDGLLRFPLPTMLREATSDAEYEIALEVADSENPLPQSANRVIEVPVQPGWFDRYGTIVLGLVGVALLGALGGFLFLRNRPQKREIPLPFNPQTRLGPPSPAPSDAQPPPSASSQAKMSSKPAVTPSSAQPAAAPTEVRQMPPMPTVVDGAQQVTVVHGAERKPRVRVKVLQTVDASQVRENTLDLPCTIGREGAAFVITGDAKISRLHAEIRTEGTRLLVVDLNSTNGTTVRDVQLEKGSSVPIEGTTQIGIGPNTTLEVRLG
jgi:hypothetical protein